MCARVGVETALAKISSKRCLQPESCQGVVWALDAQHKVHSYSIQYSEVTAVTCQHNCRFCLAPHEYESSFCALPDNRKLQEFWCDKTHIVGHKALHSILSWPENFHLPNVGVSSILMIADDS